MSARHVRRVQKQQLRNGPDNDPGSEDEEEAPSSAAAAPFNPFDLLSDEEEVKA